MSDAAKIIELTSYAKPSHYLTEQSSSQTKIELSGGNDVTGGEANIRMLRFREMVSKLNAVFKLARKEGWDDDGAAPITDSVFFNATKLLAAMPLDLPLPELVPDNDGYLELEWYDGDSGRNCSLYVTDTNLMLFAAYYDDDERLSGRFNFSGEIPERVHLLIKDACAKN